MSRSNAVLRVSLAGLAAALLLSAGVAAAIESSCPAPCTVPPKTVLFVREPAGSFDADGKIDPLVGTLAKGKARTILRVDTAVNRSSAGAAITGDMVVEVNGVIVGGGLFSGGYLDGPCQAGTTAFCTSTGLFWLDIDAAEAVHPGVFLNQPLAITVNYHSTVADSGMGYAATFVAQLIKKK